MRYIDIDSLEMPDGWPDRAKTASSAVEKGADPNDYDSVWRELKNGLAELSIDKCWYCESPIDRSDNAVDHYRPKNRVSDATRPHTGYRWLAFDFHNYRYACTFCNSRRKDIVNGTAGGKADRFPLLDESTRLYGPGPLQQERPVLLDPCNIDDSDLLGCKQENGKPCCASENPIACQRVAISIEIYHLHYEPTCKQRHRLAVQLFSDIEQAKLLFEKAKDNAEHYHDFITVAKKIKRVIDRKAPFSGEMMFLLKGQRHADHPWIQKLIEI